MRQQENRRQPQENKEAAGVGKGGDQYAGADGLTARHYADTAFGGESVTRVDSQVLYDTGFTGGQPAFASLYSSQVAPVPAIGNPLGSGQSVRYTGFLTAPSTGTYRIGLTGWGDAKVFLDDHLLVDMTGADGRRAVDAPVQLTAGHRYAIRVEYAATRPLVPLQPGSLVLQWAPPASALSPGIKQAVAAARASDVAVVYVRTYESEERDRVSLKLPQSADRLISAVTAANPRTVVVLATAGAVTMPWLSRVPAVLQSYMGGQEEGNSLARILFGNVAPSGHLPISYPRNERALPPGVHNPWDTKGDLDVDFSEGVNIGYRGYIASKTKPLFPFGFGLSYTSFTYPASRAHRDSGPGQRGSSTGDGHAPQLRAPGRHRGGAGVRRPAARSRFARAQAHRLREGPSGQQGAEDRADQDSAT